MTSNMPTRPRRGRAHVCRDEQGSLPLVMLAAIIVAGLIVVVFSDVRFGIETARTDRDYNAAIQAADAGIQAAFTELARYDPDDLATVPIDGTKTASGTLGEGSFSWVATRTGINQWEVRSTGEVRGLERVVEAGVGPIELFPMAAFGDTGLHLTGGNNVQSYGDMGVPGAMQGSVGTNGSMNLSGSTTAVDRVFLYQTDDYQQSASTVRLDDGIFNIPHRAYFPNVAEEAYADDGYCVGKEPYQAWNGESPLERGQSYCFLDVTFPPGATNLTGTSTEPVTIYIHPGSDLHVDRQGSDPAIVNMDPVDTFGMPDATMLQIFVASGTVSAKPGTVIAAGIFAPTSTCSGPNAQGTLYGALVCGSMLNAGQWDFYYDERFIDIYSEEFQIRGWREEAPGTTSFATGG